MDLLIWNVIGFALLGDDDNGLGSSLVRGRQARKALPGSPPGSTPQSSITSTPTPHADNNRKTTLQCLSPYNTTTVHLLRFLLPQLPQSLKEHSIPTSIILSYNLPSSLGTLQCRHLRHGQKRFRPQTLHPLPSLKAGTFDPRGPRPRRPAEAQGYSHQQLHQQRRPSTSSVASPMAMQAAQNPRSRAPTAPSSPQPPSTLVRARASSNAQSDSSKFSLANLIASAPKLNRKSYGRSIGSSRKSDSDSERKSVTGESGVSLTQKYGVCQKVAIGKGATSVVWLAHKWDRTEEKLYAVKVSPARSCLSPPFPRILLHGSKYAYHSSSSLRSSGSITIRNKSEKEYVKELMAEFCISSTLRHANVETVDVVEDENKAWCKGDLYAAIKKGDMSPSKVECCFK